MAILDKITNSTKKVKNNGKEKYKIVIKKTINNNSFQNLEKEEKVIQVFVWKNSYNIPKIRKNKPEQKAWIKWTIKNKANKDLNCKKYEK